MEGIEEPHEFNQVFPSDQDWVHVIDFPVQRHGQLGVLLFAHHGRDGYLRNPDPRSIQPVKVAAGFGDHMDSDMITNVVKKTPKISMSMSSGFSEWFTTQSPRSTC